MWACEVSGFGIRVEGSRWEEGSRFEVHGVLSTVYQPRLNGTL
jgi:hypothetical protein